MILCGNLNEIGPIAVALELDPHKDNNSNYSLQKVILNPFLGSGDLKINIFS